jgi:hypothetical protein
MGVWLMDIMDVLIGFLSENWAALLGAFVYCFFVVFIFLSLPDVKPDNKDGSVQQKKRLLNR